MRTPIRTPGTITRDRRPGPNSSAAADSGAEPPWERAESTDSEDSVRLSRRSFSLPPLPRRPTVSTQTPARRYTPAATTSIGASTCTFNHPAPYTAPLGVIARIDISRIRWRAARNRKIATIVRTYPCTFSKRRKNPRPSRNCPRHWTLPRVNNRT